jgi:3-oxoacyl-[acyl-carrier protein] reductase
MRDVPSSWGKYAQMLKDFLKDLFQAHIDAGSDPQYWWDETVPLESIDKRVTDLLDLRGKRAVVTGGAGMNLGQACVNRLAGLGADVAVVDLKREFAERSGRLRWSTPPDAEQVADEAAAKWGARVIAVHGDIMDWDNVQMVLRECHDRLGGIDILVNNANSVAVGEFSTMSLEDIDRSVRGTFLGAVYCTRTALDYMIPRGSGCIINVGSEAGVSATPLLTLYGALKAGLNGFTEFLGKEVAKHGIRVVGVNPGCMWGPDRELLPDSVNGLYSLSRTALQRFQLPEEVANMIAFLASDAASCIVGSMINMGGGMSL